MQDMKRATLSHYAKRNKTLYDLKKYANGVLYLRSNNLRTVSELQSHISDLRTENNQIFKAVKEKTQRIENLNKCFGYAETIRATQKLSQNGRIKIFKDNFYNAHKNEIDQYQRARAMLEKLSGNNKIQPKKWTQEIGTLEKKSKS